MCLYGDDDAVKYDVLKTTYSFINNQLFDVFVIELTIEEQPSLCL